MNFGIGSDFWNTQNEPLSCSGRNRTQRDESPSPPFLPLTLTTKPLTVFHVDDARTSKLRRVIPAITPKQIAAMPNPPMSTTART